jgi:hypothetical protein
MPKFMIDKLRETFEMQEQAKERNGIRVQRLLERVRRLEQDSWDKEGAVEDLGSAA